MAIGLFHAIYSPATVRQGAADILSECLPVSYMSAKVNRNDRVGGVTVGEEMFGYFLALAVRYSPRRFFQIVAPKPVKDKVISVNSDGNDCPCN